MPHSVHYLMTHQAEKFFLLNTRILFSPPTKLREGNVSVMFICSWEGSLLTITDDALDLTVEENYLHLQIFPTKMH